ncbi:MAG: ABC transporter ATP-binding protein [Geminicoccaceae bacterium]
MAKDDQELAIKVEDLGIYFQAEPPALRRAAAHLAENAKARMKGLIAGRDNDRAARGDPPDNWVFRHLSFDVPRGEVFGIIGGNGSGKTTLLKILSRILYPCEGRAEIRGRVASLLAVGTGFNQAYTGRENIYMNGLILGLSRKDIDRRFDDIVDFADIGPSLDLPVRNYSSGMRARLAFSVAAQLSSDIVMLDEVLSVGDAGFRQKSLDVIRSMKRDGRTILLVSHNMSAIDNFCDRAMVIADGGMTDLGEPKTVIRRYLDSFIEVKRDGVALRDRQDREGNGRLLITDYAFETASGMTVRVPRAGDDITLILDYEGSSETPLVNVDIGFAIKTAEGSKLVRFSTESLGCTMAEIPPRGRFRLFIPRFPFSEESYLCGFRVLVAGEVADSIPDAFRIDVGRGDYFGSGHVDDHSPVYVSHDWTVEEDAVRLPEKIVAEARR